jgi:hypothetical protein
MLVGRLQCVIKVSCVLDQRIRAVAWESGQNNKDSQTISLPHRVSTSNQGIELMPSSFAMDSLRIKQIAEQIDARGFARLNGALNSQELRSLRTYTEAQAALHKGEYFAHHGETLLGQSPLAALWESEDFQRMLASLYRSATGKESTSQEIFPVLRCVQGNQGRRESNCFHFDASLVTVLVPIFIPAKGEERGDLMLFPNVRGVRRNAVLNAVEKALVQNAFTRKLMVMAINRGWLKPETLTLKPGDIYVFWGYRTLHANKTCGPKVTRATAIFHFGDPHAGSLTTRLILQINQRRARRASRKAGLGPSEVAPG